MTQPSLQIATEFPFGLDLAPRMAAALPASPARHVVMRGAGHLPFVERPAGLPGRGTQVSVRTD